MIALITRILLQLRAKLKRRLAQRKDLGMVIGIGLFIPPCTGIEYSPADQIGAPSALYQELTAPFVEHFLIRQLAAVRRV